jgi:DNA transposition AAA+ family ATPase
MHTLSQPPTDREDDSKVNQRIAPNLNRLLNQDDKQPAQPTPVGDEPQKVDADLVQLIRGRLNQDFRQSHLSREIGVSEATLSQWINNKPPKMLTQLEARLRYWVNTIDERIDLTRELKPTAITKRMAAIIRSIVRTNDLGIITGRAGIGKTCGAKLFTLEFPMAVFLNADYGHNTAECLTDDLWALSRQKRRRDKEPRRHFDILVARFKDSHRPILVDNAHTLTKGGLKWCYAFHNLTGTTESTRCPMILISNPCVEEKILSLADEDQFTTRTGQFRHLAVHKKEDAEELAALILEQYAPGLKVDLLAPATEICLHRGFVRRLKKQLLLALQILEGGLQDDKVIRPMRDQGMTNPQIALSLAASQLTFAQEKD